MFYNMTGSKKKNCYFEIQLPAVVNSCTTYLSETSHLCYKIPFPYLPTVALSREDDKRIILEDGIHTLAHGHHKSITLSKT